jgi:predicted nucleotidyltransferase
MLLEDRNKIIEPIKNLLLKSNITKAALFGSFARNEEVYNDIDILIETNNHTFFDLLKLESELSILSNIKVDLVEYNALKNSMKESVIKDSIVII